MTTIGTFEEASTPAARVPRSRAAVASGTTMLAALPLAIASALTFGGGDGVVVHGLFALGMMLMLVATRDFRVPAAITWIGRTGIAGLGLMFLAQGLADAFTWQPLVTFAYDVVGQVIERVSIYPILVWFVALFVFDSAGKTRGMGAVVLSALFAAELYLLAVMLTGDVPDMLVRTLYLLPFVWLVLEGAKPR